MKIIFLFIFLYCINLFSNEIGLDSLTLSKIEKNIKKEEEISVAYKKYLLDKGIAPTIDNLINNGYLPTGYSKINPFGKEMKISTTEDYSIENSLPSNLKSNLYDYYYTNKYRTNTQSPLSFDSSLIKIKLDSKEKYVFDNKSKISTTKTNGKYYLENGVLHWYNSSGNYIYSYNNELIVDSSVTIANSDGSFNSTFLTLLQSNNLDYAGLVILQEKNGVVEDYIITDNGIVALNENTKRYGTTLISFSKNSGGMIVNGDIYTWGNNTNKITGIDSNTYSGYTNSSYAPTITTLIRAKVKPEDSEFVNQDTFSSSIRPKFVDLFSNTYNSTCGIDTNGILYCGGSYGKDPKWYFGTLFTHTDSNKTGEMLYKSTFFDGGTSSPKAKKIFANDEIWHILSEDGDIYLWGYDSKHGFAGMGYNKYNYDNSQPNINLLPTKMTTTSIVGVKFNDISVSKTEGYRKILALSTTGYLYIWGMDLNNSNMGCSETWESKKIDLCSPYKLNTTITFKSIQAGLESFIALGSDGYYYKIYQPKNYLPIVEKIETLIKANSNYVKETDDDILSMDISSKITSNSTTINKGIVWVNSKYELKGDFTNSSNQSDTLFTNAIKSIKWKKIKVIDDNNGMCGIDTSNQMYCWGIMTYKDSTYAMKNTFMLPVFNTNLFDSTKDFLLAEGGSNYLTNMTSNDWSSSGAFFIKYPTYIGGFNYDFDFK